MKIFNSHAYKTIVEFYGEKRAKRSQIPYINHINEGLIILNEINATFEAQKGFCLHPIFQVDKDFAENIKDLKNIIGNDLYVLTLVMEYRSVANEYLSPKGILQPEQIRLSPLKDVNDMLVADKIQNRKDFELNKEKYPNATTLEGYFKAWLSRLKIEETYYKYLIKKLQQRK